MISCSCFIYAGESTEYFICAIESANSFNLIGIFKQLYSQKRILPKTGICFILSLIGTFRLLSCSFILILHMHVQQDEYVLVGRFDPKVVSLEAGNYSGNDLSGR